MESNEVFGKVILRHLIGDYGDSEAVADECPDVGSIVDRHVHEC